MVVLVACFARPAAAKSDEPDAWEVWAGSQVLLARPAGSFHPPHADRAMGIGATASLVPPGHHVGLRFEYGSVELASHLNDIRVPNPNGLWVDNLTVQTGSRLSWGMIGAQWEARPKQSGFYCFASGGFGWVSPMEVLGNGYPLIEADVPGLPPSHSGFAWSAGAGSRLRIPGHPRFALTGEVAYRKLGSSRYVASPGIQGDFPDTRYVVAQGAVDAWTAQLGLALHHARH